MARAAAKKPKVNLYEELATAAKVTVAKGETYEKLMTRLCRALDKMDEPAWEKLSDEAKEWATAAFELVANKQPGEIEAPDGCPINPAEDDDDDEPTAKVAKGKAKPAAKGKAKAPDPDDEDDEDGEEAGDDDEDDEDDEPPAKVAKGKAKPAVKGKAKIVDPDDDEDEDDDEDDDEPPAKVAKGKAKPVPVSAKVKGKAKAPEPDDDDEDQDDDEPKAKKGVKKAKPAEDAGPSDSTRFVEMVVQGHEKGIDVLTKRARKAGLTCQDSQLRRIYQQTMMVIKVLQRLEMI